MRNVNVAIIHGIGVNKPGYSVYLQKGIKKQFDIEIRKILNTADSYSQNIQFEEIVWDDILGKNQEKFKGMLERRLQQKKRKSFLKFWSGISIIPLSIIILLFFWLVKYPIISSIAFLIFGYSSYYFGSKLYYQLRTTFASEYIMDVIGYPNDNAKNLIQKRIMEGLVTIDGDKEPVTFISHSLGTVIASDFVWDRQSRNDFGDFSLSNFFTMGSPLALFALRCGAEMFNKPIRLDDPFGCWVNILDNDDPIAYPLKILNDEYAALILEDKKVNVGPLGISHIKYWPNRKVQSIIAKKLAIDWLRLNDKLDSAKIKELYEAYAKTLKD